MYLSPGLIRVLIEELHIATLKIHFDSLSPREFEIVQYLIRGVSVAEICQKLTLHSSTVGHIKPGYLRS